MLLLVCLEIQMKLLVKNLQMKNQNKSRNKILLFLAILFLLVFCCRIYLKNQLLTTYSQSTGKIIRLVSGGPSGSIDFRYAE